MRSNLSGNVCNPISKKIYGANITIENGVITSIIDTGINYDNFILPGLIDSHIHIESSLLVPSEFALAAVAHGTVATVSDPHEIANVNGIEGVNYMIENGKQTPFKFYFGAPSCVPATNYETSGAIINSQEIDQLLSRDDIKYLSEMMNYPGVLNGDDEVYKKINIAHKYNKPIDGHSPGLRGQNAKKYIDSGITTDHECFQLDEAIEKIKYGMKILIREGTAARNFEELHPLLSLYPQHCMFCSDDKHPDDLLIGHINKIMARAIAKGHNFFNVLRAATINPKEHYNLNVGMLQIGDPADMCIVNNITTFDVLQTYIDGQLVYDNGKVKIESTKINKINNFNCNYKKPEQFAINSNKSIQVKVINAIEGQLITQKSTAILTPTNGIINSDISQDIIKIAVVNRYNDSIPAIGFIKNFGIRTGAIATSVAHDSHNIISIGVTDSDICTAVNTIINSKGGLCVVNGDEINILELPIAGLMSTNNAHIVASQYTELNKKAKELGCLLQAPFMTASFMALLVIPYIKLSDKGLFDCNEFQFTELIDN